MYQNSNGYDSDTQICTELLTEKWNYTIYFVNYVYKAKLMIPFIQSIFRVHVHFLMIGDLENYTGT